MQREQAPDAEMLITPSEVLWNGCCLAFAPFGSGPLTTTITAAAVASRMIQKTLSATLLQSFALLPSLFYALR